MDRIASIEFPLSNLGDNFSPAGKLHLRSKEITLANNVIRQFWVPKPGLFGTRNKTSRNHEVILEFYKLLCINRIDDACIEPAKTHLLASLIPDIRCNRAQDIFPDASLKLSRGRSVTSAFGPAELEPLLRESENEQLTIFEFCRRNREAVEFPEFPETTFGEYRNFEQELFLNTTSLWWNDPNAAYKLVSQRWNHWYRTIGRRGGNEISKDVLNILSYESKAAFHQCYSAIWFEILPYLKMGQPNQEIFHKFHSLWHLDQRMPYDCHRSNHLLHGLVLGLHPAFGVLLRTQTGSRLVGAMLEAPEDNVAQERFLHAGLVSLFLYAAERNARRTVSSRAIAGMSI